MTRLMLATVLMFGSLASAAEVTFALTGDNTKITFVGTKPEGKHDGGFKTVKGTATVDPSDVTTLKLSVEIDMNSTYSDDNKLTAHLKSPDFFGVKTNPKSKFVSTKVVKNGNQVSITGDLTLNGKTKEVTFPAKVSVSGDRMKLTSSFKIDRTNWGMTYGKGKIDDEVSLAVTVEASK